MRRTAPRSRDSIFVPSGLRTELRRAELPREGTRGMSGRAEFANEPRTTAVQRVGELQMRM